MNENQRVQQVLLGNTSAFAYFVETYQEMAIIIAHRICGNMQDAENVWKRIRSKRSSKLPV